MTGAKIRTRRATLAITMMLPEGANLKDPIDFLREAIDRHAAYLKTPTLCSDDATMAKHRTMREFDPKTVTIRMANMVETTEFPAGAPPRNKGLNDTIMVGGGPKPTVRPVPLTSEQAKVVPISGRKRKSTSRSKKQVPTKVD